MIYGNADTMYSYYQHIIRTTCLRAGLFIGITSIFLHHDCPAQDFKSEKDLQKRADKLFQDDDYITAFPLFSQLLSLHPGDVNYEYKFSVCMLYADKDKEAALSRLKRVSLNPGCDKKIFYYLGRVYHLNYRFSEAIEAYRKFKNGSSNKEMKDLQVDRQIEMCNNGLDLLRHKTPLNVIKKTEIKEADYFRAYDMELFNGNLVVKPDEFQSDADKEKKEQSIIFVKKKAEIIYYSSYGTAGDNKDIYSIEKQYDGSFGSPSRLSDVINTPYDEDFPFMHSNGNTLYFCSKGHNSMGGYDIFRTTYDEATGDWTEPVNLDFPINSADDDIFYLASEDEKAAYFSSKRTSIKGMLSVYKIQLEQKPGINEVLAAGEKPAGGEGTGLLALEDIKETVALDVNVTEEEPAVVLNTAKREIAPALMPAKPAEITEFSNLSNDQIVNIAYDNAKIIEDEAEKLEREAEITSSIAAQKNELAAAKEKESETILVDARKGKDKEQKQVELQRAEELKKESEQLKKEAEVVSGLAATIKSDAGKRQEDAEAALSKARQIESMVSPEYPESTQAATDKSVDESIVMLIEQKKLVESSVEKGTKGALGDIERQTEKKQMQASESYEKMQYIENEIAGIKEEVTGLRKEAGNSKDAQIKNELLRQAEELEGEMNDSEKELAATLIKAEQLETEVKSLKKEANVIYEVTKEIEESAPVVATASIVEKRQETVGSRQSAVGSQQSAVGSQQPAASSQQSATDTRQEEIEVPEEIALATKPEEQEEETAVGSEQPATSNQQPAASNQQSTTGSQQPATSSRQPVADTRQEEIEVPEEIALATKPEEQEEETAIGSEQPATSNQQPAASNQQPATSSQQPATSSRQPVADTRQEEIEVPEEIALATKPEEQEEETAVGSEQPAASNQQPTTGSHPSYASTYAKASVDEKTSDGKQPVAIAEREKSQELKIKAEEQKEASRQLLNSMDTVSDPVVFQETFNEAEELKQLARENTAKADSLDQIIRNIDIAAAASSQQPETSNQPSYASTYAKASVDEKASDGKQPVASIQKTESALQRLDREAYIKEDMPYREEQLQPDEDIQRGKSYREGEIALAYKPARDERSRTTEPEPESFSAMPSYTGTAVPASAPVLEYDVFEMPSVPVYSESNPIPIDKKLPGGVVFKVQIGAFRKPIPQDLFKGVSPLMGENTQMGFIRYTAGMFKNFKSANEAKNMIRGFGYRDAFVVAFNNGTRITLNEAMAMLGEKPIESVSQYEGTRTSTGGIAFLDFDGITPTGPTDLSTIKGLLYTVQIGVYSKPVTLAQLNNVNPVYGTTTTEGYIRYTHGIYGDLVTANSAKRDIVDKGITDAFVTAYYNGNRISISKAKALESSELAGIEERPEVQKTQFPKEENEESMNADAVYKVQIGSYKGEVPVEIASIYLDLVSMGIDQYEDENGFTVYTAGSFIDRKSAEELKDVIVRKGLKDAFVMKAPQSRVPGGNQPSYAKATDGKQLAVGSQQSVAPKGASNQQSALTNQQQEAEEIARAEEVRAARAEELVLSAAEAERKTEAKNEAERLLVEIQDAYTGVETLEKNAQDDMKRATAILSDVSIGLEDDVRDIEMKKAEEFVQRAMAQHRQAKNVFELAQNLKGTAKDKMLGSGFSEGEADDYLLRIIPSGYNEGFITQMPEAEAGALQQEVNDAYKQAEELQNSARDNITQAHDVLYNSETIDDEIKLSVQLALGKVEETKDAYGQAKNTLYAARYKMILGGYTKEYIDGYLTAASVYDNNLLVRMPESEAGELQREIQSNYDEVAKSEDVVRDKINISRTLCDTINSDSNTGKKEEEISRAAELMQTAITEHQRAKNAFGLAQNLGQIALYKMLLGAYSKEEADNYLSAITPAFYDSGLLDSLPGTQAAKLQREVNDTYTKSNEFQNGVRAQLDEARSVLYAIENIDEKTKQLVEQALKGVENAELRYEQSEFKLYDAKCRMILGAYSKEYVNSYLIASSEYDRDLIKKMPGPESEELLVKTRKSYNEVARIEDEAQRKLDESQNIMNNAEGIQYPDVKKQEVEKAGEIKMQAMQEMQEATEERQKAQNIYEISRYKFLLGGLDEDDADYQRLEYIPQ